MRPRFKICIPTFNNPATIVSVAADCLRTTAYPVLIVDDGSTTPVEELLRSSQAPAEVRDARERGRLEVLRFDENRGKGVALQAAFARSVAQGFTHLITVDGDGQHLASEIPTLARLAEAHPWDLIIGNRRMDSETVPGVSKFGRSFSNYWVGYQTGARVSDSQSGFRVYPLFHVQNLRFFTRRFDFEIEVMIRLIWRGVTVREAEIAVHYPPAGERVSHFDKLWDNVRISLLNTVLVAVSLLRSHRSAREIGLATGVGVLVGCTPFFGFHTAIVAGLAFLFRLNAAYLWLGTQVSIPPLAPFLALGSIRIGSRLLGVDPKGALGFSWSWMTGSLVLGSVLGLALGLLAAAVAGALRRRGTRARPWTGKTRGGKLGNWILIQVTRRIGLRAGYFCLYFIIPYFYLFAPKARRSSNEYWRLLRPEQSWARRQLQVMAHLLQFARILIDRVYQGASAKPRFGIRSNGMENILNPVRSGEGLILLSAHLGGWDMAAAALKQDGLASEFHMVRYQAAGITFEKVRGSNPEHLKDVASNLEQQPVLTIRHLLEQGKPVGLMADRPLGNHYELVSFLGRLAPIDGTPFRIAAICQSLLLFTFGFKGEGGAYDFYATPARRYAFEPGVDKALQCQRWAQEFATVLEGFVRRYPDQWSNFFPFWSTPPGATASAGPGAATSGSPRSAEPGRKPEGPKPGWGAAPTPSGGSGSRA